jgi:hypothetical protein
MTVRREGALCLTGVSDDVEEDRNETEEGGGRVNVSGQESDSSPGCRINWSLFASNEEADSGLGWSSSDHCDDGTMRCD